MVNLLVFFICRSISNFHTQFPISIEKKLFYLQKKNANITLKGAQEKMCVGKSPSYKKYMRTANHLKKCGSVNEMKKKDGNPHQDIHVN